MTNALELFASRFSPPRGKDGEELSVCIPSLTGAADAFLALTLATANGQDARSTGVVDRSNGQDARSTGGVLAITPGLPDADRLADDLRLLTAKPSIFNRQSSIFNRQPSIVNRQSSIFNRQSSTVSQLAYATRILEFPPKLDDDKSTLGARLKTIAALKAWSLNPYPCVVVASFPALATPIPTGTEPFRLSSIGSVGAIGLGTLVGKLSEFGYERLPQVEKEGDFSVRGGIVDLWSPGEEFPVRAEFFGDDLESLRTFNPATQTSIERIDTAEILPVSDLSSVSGLKSSDGREDGRRETGDERPREDGRRETRDERSLFDLLPKGSKILALEHNSYNLSSLHLSPSPSPSPFPVIFTGDPAPSGVPTYDFQTAPLPGFAELGADEAHHPELFDAARKRLEQHIAAAEKRGDLVLKLDDLSGGFELAQWNGRPGWANGQDARSTSAGLGEGWANGQDARSTRVGLGEGRANGQDARSTRVGLGEGWANGQDARSTNLLVVTKSDRVFAKRTHRRNSSLFTHHSSLFSGPRLSDFDDIEPGEYVVHIDYGVGRYVGSSEIVVDGRRSEVFTIEYADGGKLHVPAAHAHLLSRYVGVKGETVHLHRLDGKRWEKDKKDAQKAVTDLASALLETQARRETVPGFAYDVDCDGVEAFDAAFPYEETPDQISAIAAVRKDLAARKPMDRLICGDAGYGKTEVAMRAAFIAAMNGKQVAVLAPTTVLAEQHFETFTARFDGTPIRIESCSRFQTAGTHAGTFRRLATGACDIVIGTHAILSPKICFHDLGLIIIDEEQRFGVRHKEWLKRLRATADVLTLSATPIPRTLYLSMTGARDLSLLRSPPRERVAVETRIVRDSDEVIRAAIEAELARGGLVFFLHNRVADIGKVEKRLKELFETTSVQQQVNPRIVVAHGQMDSATLARKMRDFERGEYDILLSTTIVESGIDIPRANTILVDRADTFGMADLYQLRGRVGRSSKQGRAYFLLPPSGLVDAEARERLDALKRHGGLGSGFNLAVRDLELRGAGNLLGSQQSGHIAAVGFSLYCQLLQRTIALMKGEKVKPVVDVKLNLDFANPRLPYEYIEEDVQRLSLMKRFAEAQDVRIVKALADEMKDRFGPLPPEAKEFVRIAELRVACAHAQLEHVDVKETRAVFYKTGSRDVFRVVDLRGRTSERKLAELMSALRQLSN